MKKTKLTRKELYDLIWNKSLKTVAQQLQTNPAAIKKICDHEYIPTPKAGYWTKVRHNKQVKKIAMEGLPDKEIFIDIVNHKTATISIETMKFKLHPLVQEAKSTLKMSETMHHYGYSGMRSTGENQLNITVTPELTSKALDFMNSFINHLILRKHTIGIKEYYGIVITIDSIDFEISLREKMKRIPKKEFGFDSYDLVPVGSLIFKLQSYPRREWQDSKDKSLLQKVPDIINYLEVLAEEKLRWIIINEENTRRIEKERLEKELQQKLVDTETQKFNKLYEDALRYNKAQEIRKYIDAIEQQNKSSDLDSDLVKMIEWGRNKADWIDPIVMREDEILGFY